MQVTYTPPASLIPFLTSEKLISLQIGPVGCLAGDALVVTEHGPIPIADIDRPMRVLSWNAKTRQYQLSQASVAFPKGTDYLYRVLTPQGEFAAAESHQLLCADGMYRRVSELQVGDVLATCSNSPLQTTEELAQLSSPSNAQRLTQKREDYQDDYGVLDRLHGLLALGLKENVLVAVPSHNDAQIYIQPSVQAGTSQLNNLQVALLAHIRSALSAVQRQTGGFYRRAVPLQTNEVSRTSAKSCARAGDCDQATPQSLRMSGFRQLVRGFGQLVSSWVQAWRTPRLTTTDRPIIALTREERKRVFWDLQVTDTHNYVTIDGAIHHNSTKTTAGIMKIAYHAAKMAPCKDGIKRSRAVWVRNTRQMLMDTSIPDFLKWFPEGVAGAYLRTELKFILKFDNVECEVLFRGLDDGNDVRRLLSLQASFAIFDEFREINPEIFSTMLGRLGRYPDKMLVPPRKEWGVDDRGEPIGGCVTDEGKLNRHAWGMSNPPDFDTYWEQYISNPPENADCFIQPSAMSDEADWLTYLPPGYYEELIKANSEDWVDVYVHSKFGKSLSGKAVFRSFDPSYHVSSAPLTPVISENLPLIIGLDLGLTPACSINQQDLKGRVLTFAELTSEGMGITRFSRELLKPLLTTRFPGHPVIIITDPAGMQRAQTDERSVVEVLRNEGLTTIPARTNTISARIAAVENLLSQQIDGKPRHLIDPSCRKLIKALSGGYRYKMKTSGDMEDKPEKNFYSHIAEAHQYACLHVDQIFGGSYTYRRQRREIQPAKTIGWT